MKLIMKNVLLFMILYALEITAQNITIPFEVVELPLSRIQLFATINPLQSAQYKPDVVVLDPVIVNPEIEAFSTPTPSTTFVVPSP